VGLPEREIHRSIYSAGLPIPNHALGSNHYYIWNVIIHIRLNINLVDTLLGKYFGLKRNTAFGSDGKHGLGTGFLSWYFPDALWP
jgi:hypothetical protein